MLLASPRPAWVLLLAVAMLAALGLSPPAPSGPGDGLHASGYDPERAQALLERLCVEPRPTARS